MNGTEDNSAQESVAIKPEFDWKAYEREIETRFRQEYPSAHITPNAKLPGKFSRVERQIDLLVEEQASDFSFRIVVDAKHHNKRIDVKDVEEFLGLVQDVEADVGIMIAPQGYTQAALNRAHYDDSRVELDVLNFKELKQFQAFCAIPHAGDAGVLIPAPFGWVIDAAAGRERGFIACLYQRGFGFEEAAKTLEWMYINLWHKDENANDLDSLIALQNKRLIAKPDAEIAMLPGVHRKDGAKTAIRQFTTSTYPAPEYTGFVEFGHFIFFCVLFSPPELAQKNLRKLRYLLRLAIPLHVTYAKQSKSSANGE